MTYRSLALIVLCAQRVGATTSSTDVDDLGPSDAPTAVPTSVPTAVPTAYPTTVPTPVPTAVPTTVAPTAVPTPVPTAVPTFAPSPAPTPSTPVPTAAPTVVPTPIPTPIPTPPPHLVPSTTSIKAIIEFDVPDSEVTAYQAAGVQSSIAKALKMTYSAPPNNLVVDAVPLRVTGVCAAAAIGDLGHCPRTAAYAPVASRRLAGLDETTLHYDYIMEGLDGDLSTSLEAAVDSIANDATVATNFVSNLITLPEMSGTGLSPIKIESLKSEKRAVIQVADENVEEPDYQRCDSDVCYAKMPNSEGKACSNINSIYLGEKSFDLGPKASNAPDICGGLCTENFEAGKGCRAFEIRNAPDEVVYCLLYKDACALGAANPDIRGQYYYSPEQPGIMGFSIKELVCGGGALILAGAFFSMCKKKTPFGGQSVKRGGYAPMAAAP